MQFVFMKLKDLVRPLDLKDNIPAYGGECSLDLEMFPALFKAKNS